MVLTRPALDWLTFSYFLSLGFMRRFQYAEFGCLCTWELGSSRSVGYSFLMWWCEVRPTVVSRRC